MKHLFKAAPKSRPLLLASAALLLGLTSISHSQPGAGQGGQGGGWGGQQGGQGGGRGQNRGQMREQQLRQTLTTAGYIDKTLQDTVIAFSTTQDQAKQALRQNLSQLQQTVSAPATTDAQAATALGQFRSIVEAAKAQWSKDVQSLDALVGFSKKPKLEALLTVMGLIGDESAFIGGNGMGGPGGMGGRGGRGGMNGQGQGGQGGGRGGMGGGMGGPGIGGPGMGGPGMDGQGGPPGPPPDDEF
jgi:hypothetical protein